LLKIYVEKGFFTFKMKMNHSRCNLATCWNNIEFKF